MKILLFALSFFCALPTVSVCNIVITAVSDTQHTAQLPGCVLEGPGFHPGEGEQYFSSRHHSDKLCGPSILLSKVYSFVFSGGKAAGTWSQPLISSSPSDHAGNITFWCRRELDCVTAHSVTWHRLYQGVLYFQNATRFHGTRVNVITFCPHQKHGFPCTCFHKTRKCSTSLCADLLYRISSKSVSKCFNVRSSLNSQLLIGIMYRPLVPNFIKIGQ